MDVRGVLAILLYTLVACQSVDVGEATSESHSWFEAQLKDAQMLSKVDLLIAIDDSSSMRDKQALIANGLPAIVNRLIAPRCLAIDVVSLCTTATDCSVLGPSAQCDPGSGYGRCWVPSNVGVCPAQTEAEFTAISDLHVAVVTSSLGSGGAPDACADERGELVTAIPSTQPLDGNGGGFLAWLPRSVVRNTLKPAPDVTAYGDGQAPELLTDFQSLVRDASSGGCGLEGQLESWYRFLVQPDPYERLQLTTDDPPRATLSGAGIDTTLLKMRHDFLRPDSLLVIVQITDEDDAWSDPLAQGGRGWYARTANIPGGPGMGLGPRGTSDCDIDATSPNCLSCAFPQMIKPIGGQLVSSDANCTTCAGGAPCPQNGWYAPGQDGLDARFTTDMRRRYGFDPRWNIQRYVDGLRSPKVPDRDHEVHDAPQPKGSANCSNPIFSRALPDGSDTTSAALCDLPGGNRTPDLVVYALVGGVTPSLLTGSPTAADWAKLLGGDAHMKQSIAPRAGLEVPSPTYTLGSDPDTGREWNTLDGRGLNDATLDGRGVGLELACTFPLTAPIDCSQSSSCDCALGTPAQSSPGGPPLCDPTTRTMQVRGKAYPSIRELLVAKGLGSQGVVSSICGADPFGAVMTAVAFRLRWSVEEQCLVDEPRLNPDCTASCVVLIEYLAQTDQAAGCTDPGTSQPDATTLGSFQHRYLEGLGDAGIRATPPVVCAYRQLAGGSGSSLSQHLTLGCGNPLPDYRGLSCADDPSAPPGWCWTFSPSQGCRQNVAFSQDGPPAGTTLDLICAR